MYVYLLYFVWKRERGRERGRQTETEGEMRKNEKVEKEEIGERERMGEISCEAVNFPFSLPHTTIMRSRMGDVPPCSRLSTHVSSSHSADVLIVCTKH